MAPPYRVFPVDLCTVPPYLCQAGTCILTQAEVSMQRGWTDEKCNVRTFALETLCNGSCEMWILAQKTVTAMAEPPPHFDRHQLNRR